MCKGMAQESPAPGCGAPVPCCWPPWQAQNQPLDSARGVVAARCEWRVTQVPSVFDQHDPAVLDALHLDLIRLTLDQQSRHGILRRPDSDGSTAAHDDRLALP